MFPRKTRRVLAWLCAAILMTAQFALAAYACPQRLPAPGDAAMAPDCASEMGGKPSPLCKAHCDQSAQSHELPVPDVLPFVGLACWSVARLDALTGGCPRPLRDGPAWLADASPPLRIQYQVFRI